MIGGYVGGIGTPLHVGDGITATLTVTEDADTLTSSAVLALKAALDKTEDADTLTAAAALKIVATADVTEDDDTLTALGIYPQSLGTLDVTEGEDTLAPPFRICEKRAPWRTRASSISNSTRRPFCGATRISNRNGASRSST